MIKRTALVALLILFSLWLSADIIYMQNGDTLKGTIVYQDQKKVVIKTRFGKMTVAKNKIKTIKITQKKPKFERIYLKMTSGQRLSGLLIYQDIKTIKLQVNNKILIIHKDKIIQMSWKPIKDTKKTIIIKKTSRWDAVWRSALIPSWGQFYDNKKTKGFVIVGIMAILAGTTVALQLDYLSKYNDYKSVLPHNPDLYIRAENARKTVNNIIVATFTAWIANIVDAVLFSSSGEKKEVRISGVKLSTSVPLTGLEFFRRF
jgi:hypothetical protein